VNKAAQRRSHTNTRLWLATEEEAQAFGDALGRIAARRIPEELAGADSDGADLIVMGATTLGYVVRNGMGVDDQAAARIAEGLPPTPPAPAPPSSTPPPPAPAPAPVSVQPTSQGPPPTAHYETAPAETAPLLISPDV